MYSEDKEYSPHSDKYNKQMFNIFTIFVQRVNVLKFAD